MSAKLPRGVAALPSGNFRGSAMVRTVRHSQVFPTAALAAEYVAGLVASGERGDQLAKRGSMTFGRFWPEFDAIERNPTTALKQRNWWNARIAERWGRKAMRSVTGPALDAWTIELRRDGLAESTIRTIIYVVSAIYREAIRHEYVTDNPVRRMAPRPRIDDTEDRILTDAEFEALLDAAPDAKVRGLLLVMRDSGLRIGEAADLRARNVQHDRLVIVSHIDRATNKTMPGLKNGDRKRDAVLSERTAEALAPLIEGKRGDDLVFPTRQGGPINLHNWYPRVWWPMVEAANLADPQPTPHDLRKTFATELGDAGMPIMKIAKILGQRDHRSIARYVKTDPDSLPNEVARIQAAARANRKRANLRAV